MRTGWPPGLLQDDDRGLSKWFASKPDARRLVRERCAEIERDHMNQHTELIELTRELREVHRGHADEGATTFSQAADMLEAQQAEIARLNKAKDDEVLIRQLVEALQASSAALWETNGDPETPVTSAINAARARLEQPCA